MAIRFECPECGKTLSVQDQLAGKKVKCPCGAVVVANPAGATPSPAKPSPAKPTPAVRPGAPGALVARPTGNAGPARPQAGPAKSAPIPAAVNSDLADLFDELTPTDLETRAQRTEAAANAPVKVDPLAAYRPDPKARGRGKSSGPAVDRPLGLSILAGLAVLGALSALGGGILHFASPETLYPPPTPINPTFIKLMGGLLIGTAAVTSVLVVSLLTPQPWAWWFATLFYSSNLFMTLANSVIIALEGNAAFGAGRAIGGFTIGVAVLAYLYRQKTRDFYSIKLAGWVGPAVSIPAGAAIGIGIVMGIRAAVVALVT